MIDAAADLDWRPTSWLTGCFCPPPDLDRRELFPRRPLWTAGKTDEGSHEAEEIGRDDRVNRVSCKYPTPLFHAARKTPFYLRAQISFGR